MKSFFLSISKGIDTFVNAVGQTVSWLTAILMVLICVDVILRYLFSSSANWIVELEWHLAAVIFLVGASYALLYDRHVRVDVFYERFGKSQKNMMNIIGIVVFLLPWAIVLIYHGWNYAASAYSYNQGSSQPNGLPARYIIKSFIPFGFFLLALTGLSVVIKSIYNEDRAWKE